MQPKGKPLNQMVLPVFSGRDMAKKLEKYSETHPVTDDIREFYIRILDDCLRNKDIGTYAYAYPEVLKQAMETYHIESTKMMRYARRRGREDEMKKILEEIEDAEA